MQNASQKAPRRSFNNWEKFLKNEQSKICERQPLKNLKEYGLLYESYLTVKENRVPNCFALVRNTSEKYYETIPALLKADSKTRRIYYKVTEKKFRPIFLFYCI